MGLIEKLIKKIILSSSKLFYAFYLLVAIASLIVFFCLSLFLYKNFYQTITQSEELISLRREVAPEDIDMIKFEEIIEKIREKTASRKITP